MIGLKRGISSFGALMLVVFLFGCGDIIKKERTNDDPLRLSLTYRPNGYPYCTNGSNTGRGNGWDTDVTNQRGSHPLLVPPSQALTPVAPAPGTLPALNRGVAGNAGSRLSSYGHTLRNNK